MTVTLPTPVLIVCDDARARMLAADALAHHGCEAIETADAELALEVLRERPDIRGLIAATNQLGLLDGVELTRIVEQERPHIRHVVLIGHEPPGPGEMPVHAHFLRRPLNVNALLALLAVGPARRHWEAGSADQSRSSRP